MYYRNEVYMQADNVQQCTPLTWTYLYIYPKWTQNDSTLITLSKSALFANVCMCSDSID